MSKGYRLGSGLAGIVEFMPILSDNYSYLLIDPETRNAAVVDPADPKTVLARTDAVKKEEGVEVTAVYTTHHHWDHAGGNVEIHKLRPDWAIVGSSYGQTPAATIKMNDGDTIQLGNLKITALHTPCHTMDHLLYFVTSNRGGAPLLFSGDTLFLGGCGRFFEGDGAQMAAALLDRVASLPDETRVFCGHEYSVANLKFAKSVEPKNKALQDAIAKVQGLREEGLPSIPSTIAEEKAYNPFMRVRESSIRQAVGASASTTDAEVMTLLREMKNRF